eukprot:scaffold232378_cov38-Prasinocladus_malaysianus.AAC.1
MALATKAVVLPAASAGSSRPSLRKAPLPKPHGFAVPRAVAPSRRRVLVAASDSQASDKSVFGMDTSEGIFGFTPFAELWVGRLAMMGFLTSLVEEGLTGQGTLQQI